MRKPKTKTIRKDMKTYDNFIVAIYMVNTVSTSRYKIIVFNLEKGSRTVVFESFNEEKAFNVFDATCDDFNL